MHLLNETLGTLDQDMKLNWMDAAISLPLPTFLPHCSLLSNLKCKLLGVGIYFPLYLVIKCIHFSRGSSHPCSRLLAICFLKYIVKYQTVKTDPQKIREEKMIKLLKWGIKKTQMVKAILFNSCLHAPPRGE